MKRIKAIIWVIMPICLVACATPEQKAARAEAAKKAQQQLVVKLASQCDADTAQLMLQQMQNPDFLSDPALAKVAQQYQQKVNAPLFQSCYKLAWENYLNQVRLEEARSMNQYWRDDFSWMRQPRWCRGYHQGKPFVYRCG